MRIFKNQYGYTLAVSDRGDNWDLYEMNDNPLSPQGVNQYSCTIPTELLTDLEEIKPEDYHVAIPEKVKTAILHRLAHYNLIDYFLDMKEKKL